MPKPVSLDYPYTEILIVAFICLGLLLSVGVDLCSAQASRQDSIIVTNRPITPITSDTAPSEYTFETNVTISKYYTNKYDNELNLSISEGVIEWESDLGVSIYGVIIFDNLGNIFEPIIDNGHIFSPKANITLPPSFGYILSLCFYTQDCITFDANELEYLLQFNLGFPNPATISVRFPENFTVLACNIYSTSSPEVTFSEEYPYTIARWDMPEKTMMQVYVPFLPFHVQGTIRSFEFTLDIPKVFPAKGGITGIIEQRFQTYAKFSIWDFNPVSSSIIAFPEYATPVSIEGVWDCEGVCKQIFEKIDDPDNSSLGCYFVDNSNRHVVIYPRYHLIENIYEYKIKAEFFIPHEYEPYSMEGIKERHLPFQYESYFAIDNVIVPDKWKVNLTGDVQLNFILPENSEILISESGNPQLDFVDNRPVARFIYNSPETLFPSRWRVIYDITPLKNLFILEVASNLVLLGLLIGAFKLSTKIVIQFIRICFGLIITLNLYLLITLGAFKTLFLLLFSLEIIIYVLIFFVTNKRLKS